MSKKLKLIIDICAFFLLITCIACVIFISLKNDSLPEQVKKVKKMEKGQVSFIFHDLSGKKYSFADFKNQVVLVNVWATWCAPCVEELPSLLRLAKFFDKLIIIAMTDESKQSIDSFFTSFNKPTQNFIIALNSKVLRIFSIQALPESFLFNKEGRLVERIVGPRAWDHLEWKEKIKKLLH